MRLWLATVVLFAVLLNAAMLYRAAPVVASPVKVASWLKTDKLQGKVVNPPWPKKIVQTESYRLDPPVEKTKLRSTAGLPWSCDQVRKATEGLTPQQIEHL